MVIDFALRVFRRFLETSSGGLYIAGFFFLLPRMKTLETFLLRRLDPVLVFLRRLR